MEQKKIKKGVDDERECMKEALLAVSGDNDRDRDRGRDRDQSIRKERRRRRRQ